MKLKDKAYNLDVLKISLKQKVKIPKFIYFSLKQFNLNKQFFLKQIKINFNNKNIIFRSSANNEDGKKLSNAGLYESVVINESLSKNKIYTKLNDYLKQFKNLNDRIIVQEFISDVDYSGVIFTGEHSSNAPYYIINYDKSGKTNLVTSGSKNKTLSTEIVYKYSKYVGKFKKLINACKILETKLKNYRLDIEFAFKQNKLFIFQIRDLPLKLNKGKKYFLNNKNFKISLNNIKKKINNLKTKNSTLYGSDTIFSNMADWNPAEMLGDKPNTLAVSLYKELITDKIWSNQRKLYGYKDVSPNPLLFDFAGKPYIDLRTDLNSLLPKDLNPKTSSIVVNYLINTLKKNPALHDKIEFELIETCYSFLSKKRLNYLTQKHKNHYLSQLRLITKNIIIKKKYELEKKKIDKFVKLINRFKYKKKHPLQNLFFLVHITKNFGTLPFAGLARCAFISQRILLDLKEKKLINDYELQKFFNSINNISSNINNDLDDLFKKKIKKKVFLDKYYHLRPSSYDINSKNYKEGFNIYFDKKKFRKQKHIKFYKFKNQKKIDTILLKEIGINCKFFLSFARNSIKLREYSKFQFTKGINRIFEELISLGKLVKIKRKDLVHIDIKNLINFYSKLETVKLESSLKNEIKKNKISYSQLLSLKLPDVIISSKNIDCFKLTNSVGNFITQKKVISNTIEYKNQNISKLRNRIIMLENADPGYDFLFNYEINGLVTKYGGSNSHMAIRCLELNIPAAIGVGEDMFIKLLEPNCKIELNCSNEMINFI